MTAAADLSSLAAPDPGALATVSEYLQAHRDDMIEDLRQYVGWETPSDDKALLDEGLSRLLAWLDGRLGQPDARRRYEAETAGDIVVSDYAGSEGGAGPDLVPELVLLCHYDTVFPAGTLAERPFTIDGDSITGPGVFDMKGGLVQAVWAIVALRQAGLAVPAFRLILNGDEETGSLASRRYLEQESQGARAAFVFEASADGAVKTARKGVGLFRIVLEGVEAHAGLDPLAGASAVHELGNIITQLAALNRLDAGTSVNVGIVQGGTRSNVTAGRATANIDVRITSAEEARRIDAGLASLAVADPRVRLTVEGAWNRPTFERTPAVVTLFELARSVASGLGFELGEVSVGGASDGNFVAALGIPVLDGLGAVGSGAHAKHENITASGLVQRAALAAGLVTSFGRPPLG